MDSITATICNTGKGRMGYARVLVEVDAQKGLHDKVEVVYRNANNVQTRIKHVSVEYSWKPDYVISVKSLVIAI